MVTKIITVKGGEFAVEENGRIRPVETHYGLSSDTKPTEGVKNADRYFEMDAKKLSLFDEAGKRWLPL